MTITDSLTWDAPGPGTWVTDATHQTAPWGRFHEATFVDAYGTGFAEGMRGVGSPLQTIEAHLVNGWTYTRVKPLGGPDEPKGGPPPKLAFEVLFRVHPELRRRLRTAQRVFDDRAWLQVIDEWRTVRSPALRRRLDQLARFDLREASDAELAAHVERTARLITDSTVVHFSHAPWGALVVGEFLVRCEQAGIHGPEAMLALAGASTAVRRPTELADAIIEALRSEEGLGALDAPVDECLAAIEAAGPRSAAALRAYLDHVGPSIAGGGSVADPTVAEQPNWIRTVLRGRLDAAAFDVDAAAAHAADAVEKRVPAADRASWRQALSDARLVAPLRDDDMVPMSESFGRARLALLEVGRRLVDRGSAAAPEHAFELRPEEVGPTLAGRGVDASQLAAWVARRERQAQVDPPATLGPPSAPPPLDRFPAAIARVTRAVFAFVSRFDADADAASRRGEGHGVSPGEVTARAVVVRELSDLDRVEPGDIIVARSTMPTYNSVLAMCGGLVTETGGAISHAAIMSRELGIPGVVGHRDAMAIPDGATICVDGTAGTVTIVEAQSVR